MGCRRERRRLIGKVRGEDQPRPVGELPFDDDRPRPRRIIAAGKWRHAGEAGHDLAASGSPAAHGCGRARLHGLAAPARPNRAARRQRSPARSDRECARAKPRRETRGNARIRVAGLRAPPRRAPARNRRRTRNGRRLAHSSPMNSNGICGDSSTIAMPACKAGSGTAVASRTPNGAIADLVVVLQKGDKGGRRQIARGFAARPRHRGTARARPDRQSPRPRRGRDGPPARSRSRRNSRRSRR